MQKLLLVDSSREFCESLLMALNQSYETQICRDGLQALEILDQFRPDILVTDLTLAGTDGLTLLKIAAAQPRRPVLVVTSRLGTPFVRAQVGQIGVDYLVVKPCNIHALAERIRDLSQRQPEPIPWDTNDLVMLLRSMNVNVSRRSCRYLLVLIQLYLEGPDQSLTKELYPAVGHRCDSNGAAVERAVRNLIEDAWEHRNEQLWRLYFPTDRHGNVIKPTNRSFIAAMSMALQAKDRRLA